MSRSRYTGKADPYLSSFGALERFNKAFNDLYNQTQAQPQPQPIVGVQDRPEVALRTPTQTPEA